MKRLSIALIAAIALTLALALPASAGAKTGELLWLCDPGSGEVTLVSAPRAAEHGIRQADSRAVTIAFEGVGGEARRVFVVP